MRFPLLVILLMLAIYTNGQEFFQKGKASYYANKFEGRRTASGAIFSNKKLTAAHRTLPFGSRVKVTNLSNNKSVIVTINDRGPFIKGRIIDLSQEAARQLGFLADGVTNVFIIMARDPLLPDSLMTPLKPLPPILNVPVFKLQVRLHVL